MKCLLWICVAFCVTTLLWSHTTLSGERKPYIVYYGNGVKKFSVDFRKNKFTGQWQSWYPSGNVCDSGRFVGSAPDGLWKGWYVDGSPRYIWHTSASKLASLKDELMRQPKTRFFVISGKPVAEAVRYFQVDHLFRQETIVPAVATRSHLLKQKTDLTRIKLAVDKNTSGDSAYVPPFSEMLLHGEFIGYYHGGKIRERGMYINGLKDGVWEEYAGNGEMSRGSYLHGVRSGEWRRYGRDGKPLSFSHYKANGQVSESHQFDRFR